VSHNGRKYVLWLVAIVLMAAIGWHLWGQGGIPLIILTQDNFDQFKNVFNKDAHGARAVLLLSPT
jgi:hypothetical protein